jgi:peptide/nickel transport system substrate-binding protein
MLRGRIALAGALALATLLAAPEPARAQDAIRIASQYRTTTLDPMRSAGSGNIEVYGLLYTRLINRDAQDQLQPALAESWEVSDDQRTYTFHLRDAKFSDGSPITAEDVAFSLNRVRKDERSAYPAPLGSVEDISAKDDKTVVFTLKAPFAPFLSNLDVWNMGVVSKKDVDARGEEKAFTENPVTSGPFMVKEWRPNDRVVLAANPNYWREGFPKTPSAELLEVTEADTRVNMLKAGEVDVVREVPWAQVDAMKTAENVEMRLEPSTIIYMVLLNSKREPFSNVKVRQAAAHAIDNKAITKAVTFGYAEPANTTLPGAIEYHDDSHPGIAYDPEKAKQLLDGTAAGDREITILISASGTQEQIAVLMQAQWNAIGLKSKIQKVDGSAWWDLMAKGEYDAAPTWWYNETPDPDLAVRWALCGSCGSDSFYTFYNNEKVNQLTEQGISEQDPQKRAEIYKEIQRITTEEVSQIPLYYPPYANAYSTRVKGLRLTPALHWTLEEATIGG